MPTSQFQDSPALNQYPVSATFRGQDEWASTGLDFSDYVRCGRQEHKLAAGRRLDAPEWAFNPSMLRALIVRMMEARAYGTASGTKPGTDAERLARAQASIAEKRLPVKEATLTKMCQQLVALKKDNAAPEYLKCLCVSIESLDSEILTLRQPDRGAAQLVGIVNYYYAVGMDSVGVGQQLGIKPPVVRQIIWKMRRIWERMKAEVPAGWRRPRIRINVLRGLPNWVEPRRELILHVRFCQKCSKQLVRNQTKWCGECSPQKAKNARAWYHRQKAKKKRYAPNPSSPDAIRRRNQLAQGLCGNRGCTNKRWNNLTQCQQCRDFYNRIQNAAYARQPERWKRHAR